MKKVFYIIPQSFNLINVYKRLEKAAEKKGFLVVYAPVGVNIKKVDETSEKLAKHIIAKKLSSIVMFTHSLGGVIAKYLLNNYPDINKKVKKVFSVSGPFKGSELASFGKFVPAYKQLIPGSEILKNISKKKSNNKKFICISSSFDLVVVPLKGAYLEGSKKIILPKKGHFFLPLHKEIIEIVEKNL